IYLKKNIPYSSAMLSTLFNKPQQIVELAIRTFSEFGMIDVDERGYIFVTNWEKHQSIDKLNKIKEKTRLRVQNHREKKKQELLESNATVTLQVTQSNAVDLELDLDIKDIPDSDECGEMFEKFWKAYPSKKGRAGAEKKWRIYYRDKKLNFEEVMEGLEKYIAYCRAIDRPFKDGQTFVNQRAWEDDWTINQGHFLKGKQSNASQLPLIQNSEEERAHLAEMARRQRERNQSNPGA